MNVRDLDTGGVLDIPTRVIPERQQSVGKVELDVLPGVPPRWASRPRQWPARPQVVQQEIGHPVAILLAALVMLIGAGTFGAFMDWII